MEQTKKRCNYCIAPIEQHLLGNNSLTVFSLFNSFKPQDSSKIFSQFKNYSISCCATSLIINFKSDDYLFQKYL